MTTLQKAEIEAERARLLQHQQQLAAEKEAA